MALSKSKKSHQSKNRGPWTHFHPPPTGNSKLDNSFKLERTSYISNEQTQVF